MRHSSRMSFKMMSFMHETLYGIFRNPYEVLQAAGLKPGQQVLEIGCGPGFFTLPAGEIVGETGRVVAIDISPFAVEHVQKKMRAADAQNIEVRQVDAVQNGLPDASFDLAFVFGFRYAAGLMDDIFREIYRVLLPSGILSVEGQLRPPGDQFQLLLRQGRITQWRKIS